MHLDSLGPVLYREAVVYIPAVRFAMQDRFEALVPMLTKYGATTVGLTLFAIGAVGLYETFTESREANPEQGKVAYAGTMHLQICNWLWLPACLQLAGQSGTIC